MDLVDEDECNDDTLDVCIDENDCMPDKKLLELNNRLTPKST